MERAKLYAANKYPETCPTIEYPIMGNNSLKITGKLRETAFEVLFEMDDYQSLTTMVLDSILQVRFEIM